MEHAHLEQGIFSSGSGSVHVGTINYGSRSGPSKAISAKGHLRNLLWFKEMHLRERAIQSAQEGTCNWIVDTSEHMEWASPYSHQRHRGNFLWIKGNAGTGKSTMMKYALDYARTATEKAYGSHRGGSSSTRPPRKGGAASISQRFQPFKTFIKTQLALRPKTSSTGSMNGSGALPGMDRQLVVSHFFNARGAALEHSAEGMYRTLIWSMFGELPEAPTRQLTSRYARGAISDWPVAELERLFKDTVALLHRPLVFFIDALDECPQNEVRRLLSVLLDAVNAADHTNPVRICLASRPYPHVSFERAVLLDLSTMLEHDDDIKRYISDRLQIGISSKAGEIRNAIYAKSKGIFLWVVLVVDMLNVEYDTGNVTKLARQLEDIPSGLHELFEDIIRRHSEGLESLLLCVQMVLFLETRLPVDLFWWCIQLALRRPRDDIHGEFELLSEIDVEKQTLSMGRGLIHIAEDDRVEAIHESLRDFILQPDVLRRLYGAESERSFAAESHQKLRDICVAEMVACRRSIIETVETKGFDQTLWLQADGSQHLTPFDHYLTFNPFAIYASGLWPSHAEEAQILGIDQKNDLHDIADQIGPFYASAMGWNADAWIGVRGSVIALLIDCDSSALILNTQMEVAQREIAAGHPFGFADEGLGDFPVPLALKNGYYGVVQALVDMYLQLESRQPLLQSILNDLARCWWKNAEFDAVDNADGPLLSFAGGSPSLATFFLLALAPIAALEPSLESLSGIVNPGDLEDWEFAVFLKVMRLFIEKDIPCLVVDFEDAHTWRWIQEWKSIFEDTSDDSGGDDQELELLNAIANLLRPRTDFCFYDTRPMFHIDWL